MYDAYLADLRSEEQLLFNTQIPLPDPIDRAIEAPFPVEPFPFLETEFLRLSALQECIEFFLQHNRGIPNYKND